MIQDELEDEEEWQLNLGTPESESVCNIEIALLYHETDASRRTLAAGATFEYYRKSNTILLAYLVVDPAYRKHGLARRLVEHVREECSRLARACTSVLRCLCLKTSFAFTDGHHSPGLLILETHKHTQNAGDVGRDSMDPTLRQAVLGRLGFAVIDFPYVQPALSCLHEKSDSLVLAVHLSCIPPASTPGGKAC